jgi:hypothetical protein
MPIFQGHCNPQPRHTTIVALARLPLLAKFILARYGKPLTARA